jgi:hypothetical protein
VQIGKLGSVLDFALCEGLNLTGIDDDYQQVGGGECPDERDFHAAGRFQNNQCGPRASSCSTNTTMAASSCVIDHTAPGRTAISKHAWETSMR